MQNQVLKILKDIRPDIDFENETGLITNGILDSFDMISILAMITEQFMIEMDVEDIIVENFDSLDQICFIIEKKKNIIR